MKLYYDCEFLEDGRTIDLISIGVVAEDGREFYAVNRDAPWLRIYSHEWLMANVVVPHLPILPDSSTPRIDFSRESVKPRDRIRRDMEDFILEQVDDQGVQLHGWYSAYDHVCLAQLWGPMVSMPDFMPYYTVDLKQEFDRLGKPEGKPADPTDEHHALADARWNKRMGEFLDYVNGEG